MPYEEVTLTILLRLELDTNFFKACSMAAEFSRLNPRAAGQIVTDQFPGLLTTMTPELILGSMSELSGLIYFRSSKFWWLWRL